MKNTIHRLKPYYTDLRAGCVAVIDRRLEDPDRQGLDAEKRGVVKFWSGTWRIGRCERCNSITGGYWDVPPDIIREANEYCRELNDTWLRGES